MDGQGPSILNTSNFRGGAAGLEVSLWACRARTTQPSPVTPTKTTGYATPRG